jgi:hypothetical protein
MGPELFCYFFFGEELCFVIILLYPWLFLDVSGSNRCYDGSETSSCPRRFKLKSERLYASLLGKPSLHSRLNEACVMLLFLRF